MSAHAHATPAPDHEEDTAATAPATPVVAAVPPAVDHDDGHHIVPTPAPAAPAPAAAAPARHLHVVPTTPAHATPVTPAPTPPPAAAAETHANVAHVLNPPPHNTAANDNTEPPDPADHPVEATPEAPAAHAVAGLHPAGDKPHDAAHEVHEGAGDHHNVWHSMEQGPGLFETAKDSVKGAVTMPTVLVTTPIKLAWLTTTSAVFATGRGIKWVGQKSWNGVKRVGRGIRWAGEKTWNGIKRTGRGFKWVGKKISSIWKKDDGEEDGEE